MLDSRLSLIIPPSGSESGSCPVVSPTAYACQPILILCKIHCLPINTQSFNTASAAGFISPSVLFAPAPAFFSPPLFLSLSPTSLRDRICHDRCNPIHCFVCCATSCRCQVGHIIYVDRCETWTGCLLYTSSSPRKPASRLFGYIVAWPG